MGEQNITLTESNYKSCIILGSWDTAVTLGDGSVMIPSNAWERKKTTCKEALKNQDVIFHVKDGDVFLGSKGSFEARSGCGETRTFYKETVKNTTVTPKTTCRGWISINNLGGRRDEWAASQVKVSAGQPGIRGVLVETGSWLFEAYKTEEDEEEGGEEEAVVQEEEDWDWSHVEWEKATVGTGTTLTGVTVLATLAVMVWRRRTQRAKENEKGDTYVTYDNNEDKTTIGQEMEGKEEKAAPVHRGGEPGTHEPDTHELDADEPREDGCKHGGDERRGCEATGDRMNGRNSRWATSADQSNHLNGTKSI